ncbi:histidinol dehydrogenase [Magnetococcales bacterium HHB-1]
MGINVFRLAEMAPEEIARIMKRSEIGIDQLTDTVAPIISAVQERGDAALLEFNKKFDQADMRPEQLKVTEEEFAQAEANLSEPLKQMIERSFKNIKKYHEAQRPEETWFIEIEKGVMAGEKITPIHSVGLYVPSGKGAFPSVMLMLGVPAAIAGVEKIIVCTPPKADGGVEDATLYAAQLCGIKEVYKTGGAQAIAAMAYGTQTVPKVVKTIGPGSSYVSAAKRLLYTHIDVGTPAGPSESIIFCDESTPAKIAALDLMIEAEHGPDSTALLVTHSEKLAKKVAKLLPKLIDDLPEPRKTFCNTGFSTFGGIVITSSLEASIDFINDFAPEHLEVLIEEPFFALNQIKNAGEILLGLNTPITMGNFSLGVNAILPTGGFAKTFSCVTIFDFLKRTSIGYLSREGFDSLRESTTRFAEYEGFPAHANALIKRDD